MANSPQLGKIMFNLFKKKEVIHEQIKSVKPREELSREQKFTKKIIELIEFGKLDVSEASYMYSVPRYPRSMGGWQPDLYKFKVDLHGEQLTIKADFTGDFWHGRFHVLEYLGLSYTERVDDWRGSRLARDLYHLFLNSNKKLKKEVKQQELREKKIKDKTDKKIDIIMNL